MNEVYPHAQGRCPPARAIGSLDDVAFCVAVLRRRQADLVNHRLYPRARPDDDDDRALRVEVTLGQGVEHRLVGGVARLGRLRLVIRRQAERGIGREVTGDAFDRLVDTDDLAARLGAVSNA